MRKIGLCLFVLAAALSGAEPATRILIAFHSDTGNTAKMAKALSEGASGVAGVEVVMKKTGEVTPEDIKADKGILLGSPVHMHNLSIEALQFLNRIPAALGPGMGEGRMAGVFCTGGAASLGKEMARMEAIATFLEMRFVIAGGLEAAGDYGNLGAEATTMNPDHAGVSDKDLASARRVGERFARLTKQFQTK